ncbi:MAG: hypothetical protein EXR72_23280 [Myxococcales bacterium]|nr:hypothetical protein [Myxococcales bacterium]
MTLDAKRGHVATISRQCVNTAAPGIAITGSTADGSSKTLYFEGGFPSPLAKETDSSGIGARLNMPPGKVTVTSTLTDGMKRHGSVDVHVRADTVTLLNLIPTP